MKVQHSLIIDYQKWFSSSHYLINEYLPERAETFKTLYKESIAKKLTLSNSNLGTGPSARSNYIYSWKNSFSTQRGILLGIPLLAEIKEKSLRKILTIDIVNSEIDEAELLYDNKHYRAAGAVAGVALERYLKTSCEINGIEYSKNGISSLAQLLYLQKPPVIDSTILNHMNFLGRIRDDCDHANDISNEELMKRVRILIDQTKEYSSLINRSTSR